MALFNRTVSPGKFGNTTLFAVPPANSPAAVMNLSDLIGQAEVDEISAFGTMQFHATGDTGKGTTEQEDVVQAMARDLNLQIPSEGPSFFLNLGDVIYGNDKMVGYKQRFYHPNLPYLQPAPGLQGVIIAVPGNHDGDLAEAGNVAGNGNLDAFLANFVNPNPQYANQYGVAMPRQPGVYWLLKAPFVDVVGLYSNAGEYWGELGVNAGDRLQRDWLAATLTQVACERQGGVRRALVFAVHHPPYALGLDDRPSQQGHAGSSEMQADLNVACSAAGVWPDAVISGHSHNYQRYMRTATVGVGSEAKVFDTAYFVVGTGGTGIQAVPVAPVGNSITETVPGLTNSRVIFKNKLKSYGYLRIAATATELKLTFVSTDAAHRSEFETVTINLATNRQSSP